MPAYVVVYCSRADHYELHIEWDENKAVLLVVHTEQEEAGFTSSVRIISCRKSTPLEQQAYEEGYE